MKPTRFRREVLAGGFPVLIGPDIQAGQVIEIESGRVWVRVEHRAKAETWKYTVIDWRPRFLARQQGRRLGRPYVEYAAGAIESVDAVSPGEQRKITNDAQKRWELYMHEELGD